MVHLVRTYVTVEVLKVYYIVGTSVSSLRRECSDSLLHVHVYTLYIYTCICIDHPTVRGDKDVLSSPQGRSGGRFDHSQPQQCLVFLWCKVRSTSYQSIHDKLVWLRVVGKYESSEEVKYRGFFLAFHVYLGVHTSSGCGVHP